VVRHVALPAPAAAGAGRALPRPLVRIGGLNANLLGPGAEPFSSCPYAAGARLPGHGRGGRSCRPRRDLTEVTLVAHSWGGYPATAAAHQLTGRVSKLIFYSALVPARDVTLAAGNPGL
jgi:pimeloyl-ACP methyl ester carboxylesterase